MSRERSVTARSIFVAVLACMGLLIGCGGESDSPSSAASGAASEAPEAKTDVVSTKNSSGQAVDVRVMGEGSVPEGVGSDVPVFPGATSSGALEMPGEASFVTLVSSNPSADEVFAFYETELPKKNWKLVSVEPSEHMLVASKSGRKLTLDVSQIDGRTEIGLMTE